MRKQILVVEDNKSDEVLIRDALNRAELDADLVFVRDGHAAIQFLDLAEEDGDAPRPDLVLLDLNLPKRTGGEVIQHLRKCERCGDAQVLIVTSSDSHNDRAAAAALEAAGYFCKPSDYESFMQL